MQLHIDFDDGRELALTPDELGKAFLLFVQALMQSQPTLNEPDRCPICLFGRIGDGYCTCQLGRDLKRIETRMPNPVGGTEGESENA